MTKTTRVCLRLAVLVGLSVALLPSLSRRVFAKRVPQVASASTQLRSVATSRLERLQALADEIKTALSIQNEVVVALVPSDKLVVSVERAKDRRDAFVLSIQEDFLGDLSEAEINAILAHELGHVWIFTHHPYLHTEELANEIAMRAVGRETLESVYEKVWKRTGQRGTLAYLPER